MATVVRESMADLIAEVRLMIADPAGENQQFDDGAIQRRLDNYRDDVRYELLTIAPSIVNTSGTDNQPQTIFADYYSKYQWWEASVVLQANNVTTGAAWVVVTPTSSDYIVGHWTFEDNVFVDGVAPGQYPPVFATGYVYDLYAASASLLEFWAATLTCAYDFSVDGRSFHRSQMLTAKKDLAQQYWMQARPRVTRMVRSDINALSDAPRVRLLDDLIR